MSVDLGLHNASINFMKSSGARMQNLHKMRILYSTAEKNAKTSSFLLDQSSTIQNNQLTSHTAYSNHIAYNANDN